MSPSLLFFFTGQVIEASGLKDVYWLAATGREMDGDDWGHIDRRSLGMQIGNHGDPAERILLLFNASDADMSFKLPKTFPCGSFQPVFDTTKDDGIADPNANCVAAGEAFRLPSRSFVLLQHRS